MSRISEFKRIERSLEQIPKGDDGNEVFLLKEDFKCGQLTPSGFLRLKQQCEHINYSDSIDIMIPKENEAGFRRSLERLVAKELEFIKREIRETKAIAITCLLVGAFLFVIGQVFSEVYLLGEITLIAIWVFIWTAIDKWFFEQRNLRNKKYDLMQIMAANVRTEECAQ
jgi:hypothetical protein